MGLDIYMYQHLDLKSKADREQKYETESKEIFQEIFGFDSEDNDAWDAKKQEIGKEEFDRLYDIYTEKRKPVAEKYGLNEFGSDIKDSSRIELSSEKYPDHMFKIGYCRSSYNDGGINRILENKVGITLYDIFGYDDDEEYIFKPNWVEVKQRAEQALKDLTKSVLESSVNCFDIDTIAMRDDEVITSEKEAIDYYNKQRKDHTDDFSDYTNYLGEFFNSKGINVRALIKGKKSWGGNSEVLYVVYDNEEGYNWYLQSIEIIIEMCDWVLSQENPETYYLHWSA